MAGLAIVSGMARKPGDSSNKYCPSTDLSNELSIESFFVLGVLAELGYEDQEIKPKRSTDEVQVVVGRRGEQLGTGELRESAGAALAQMYDTRGTHDAAA